MQTHRGRRGAQPPPPVGTASLKRESGRQGAISARSPSAMSVMGNPTTKMPQTTSPTLVTEPSMAPALAAHNVQTASCPRIE